MSVEIRLKIDARAAILARKTTVGLVTVQVTDDDLNEASDKVLAGLAEVVASDETLEGPGVVDASFKSVVAGLETRTARVEEARARGEAQAAEVRASEVRATEEDIARRRQAEERVARHADAITRWIEENCDEEMINRRRAGFLRDDEIIEEVMDQLLEITEDEHMPLKAYQACECDKGCTGSVQYLVGPVEHLDSAQYAALERIKAAAPDESTVTPQARKAVCPECACVPIVRMTALVQLPWNGWMLKKVYSLG